MKLKPFYIIFLLFLFISVPIHVFSQMSTIFQSNADGTLPPVPVPPGDPCAQYCDIDIAETRVAQIRDMTGDALHTITSAGVIDSGTDKWKVIEYQSCANIVIFNRTFNTSIPNCITNHINVRHDSDPTGIYLIGGATCNSLDGYILTKLDFNTGATIWEINDNINNFDPDIEGGVTPTIIELNARSIVVGRDGIYVGGNYEERYFLSVVKQRSFLKKFSKTDGSLIWAKQILQDSANGYESVENLAYNIDTVYPQIDTAGNFTSKLPRQQYVQSINRNGVITTWSTLTETIANRLPIRIRADSTNVYAAYRNALGNNSIIYKLSAINGSIVGSTGLITTKVISDMNLDGDNIYYTWYYGVDKRTKLNMTIPVWSTNTTCASFALFINGKVMIQSIMNNNNWRLENRLLNNGNTVCTFQVVSCPIGIPPTNPQSQYWYGAQDLNSIYLGYGQADQNNLDSTSVPLSPFP